MINRWGKRRDEASKRDWKTSETFHRVKIIKA